MKLSEVKQLLNKDELNPKKKFGQNFLVDDNILKQIVDYSNIDENTNIIEIGPGLGSLTEYLIKKAKKVVCYEIDHDMVNVLNDRLISDNLLIVEKDFLKVDLNEDILKYFNNEKVYIVANLPYYVTTAILVKVLEETDKIEQMTVMMQQDVAKRICGKPSTKDYNSLSVLINYYTESKIIINVGRKCFYPEPNVDSSVVLISQNKEKKLKVLNEEYFKKFNRAIFFQRRKTIVNNLKMSLGYSKEKVEEILLSNNLSISQRAENLSTEQIILLANSFFERVNK